MMKHLIYSVSLLTLSVSLSASAANMGSYKAGIPVSEAVARPSYNATTGRQNPAGLVNNKGSRVHVDTQSGSTSYTNPEFGADFLFGGGTWGGGIGADYFSPPVGDAQLTAAYGLSVYAQSLKTALGVGGRTGITGANTDTTIDVGLLIGPYDPISFGVTMYNLTGGLDNLGAGVGFDLGHTASIVVDTITTTDFDGFLLKPGIWVGSPNVGLTVSYGFDLGDGNIPGAISGDGIGIGANILLGRSVNMQLAYEEINTLYAGFTFEL